MPEDSVSGKREATKKEANFTSRKVPKLEAAKKTTKKGKPARRIELDSDQEDEINEDCKPLSAIKRERLLDYSGDGIFTTTEPECDPSDCSFNGSDH